MRISSIIAALVCAARILAVAVVLTWWAADGARAQQSQLQIGYDPPTNAQLQPIYQRLKQRAVLEEMQAFLAPLHLPRPLTIKTAQCGATTLDRRPPNTAVVCYEMVAAIEKIVAQHTSDHNAAQSVIMGAFVQTALHETSRAIFEVLDVPIWGRERDAADRLAALIMTQFGEDVSSAAIFGTADLFMWSDKTWTGSDFSDTGSPAYQRFFNYVCIAYAAAPLQFGDLVERGFLPKRRSDRCQGEYDQIRRAFDLRIMPYVDPDLLIKARATPWLSWAPPK
jgi:hypothetical protein